MKDPQWPPIYRNRNISYIAIVSDASNVPQKDVANHLDLSSRFSATAAKPQLGLTEQEPLIHAGSPKRCLGHHRSSVTELVIDARESERQKTSTARASRIANVMVPDFLYSYSIIYLRYDSK